MAQESMDLCLRVLKESNKSRFDSYSLGKSVSYPILPFGFVACTFFATNFLEIAVDTGPLTIATDLDSSALAKRMAAFETRKGSLNLLCAHDSCTVAKAGTLSFPFPP